MQTPQCDWMRVFGEWSDLPDPYQKAAADFASRFNAASERTVVQMLNDGYRLYSITDLNPPPNNAAAHRDILVDKNKIYATIRAEWETERRDEPQRLRFTVERFMFKREPLAPPPWPDLRAAETLRHWLVSHKPECANCLRSGTQPVDPTGWDHDFLADTWLKRCATCSVPSFPWAHRLTAERLLEWLNANPESYGPEYAEQIRKDCLGEK